MKSIYSVIKRPLVTEKSSNLSNTHHQVVLEVAPAANKIEIARAANEIFGVDVEQVKTLNVRGKMKRVGKYTGKKRNWKKAIITLSKDSDLDAFGILPPVAAAEESDKV